MNWLRGLIGCSTWNGHRYRRHGDYMVCMNCGHRVKVKA